LVIVPNGNCGLCLNSKSLHFYFFEGAADAALEEGEAGPKKGLQEGFG
jgi:hypothetical protein